MISRPAAKARMRAFVEASRRILGPREVDVPGLLGGAVTRHVAFRHLAVASTLAALDIIVRWECEEAAEAQRRVLMLRRT
ncbi:MAG: hypothetical protein ACKPKO_37390, partial [Candidatus Fonsibacter sp.]